MKLIKYLILIFAGFLVSSFSGHQTLRIVDFSGYFKAAHVDGCFVLYDIERDRLTVSNAERCKTGFLPASTFKVFNSLAALETGVATGKDFLIKWDGVDHGSAEWNRDHTLESAFKTSAYWYYQEIARRIGAGKMEYWLKRTGYGNQNMGGGVDQFWLKGDLRITPIEQTLFVSRLIMEKLPFSKANQMLVKELMLEKQDAGYQFGAKTGWAILPDGTNIGWLVGYVQKKGKWFTFATNIESKTELADFRQVRRELTTKILDKLEPGQ